MLHISVATATSTVFYRRNENGLMMLNNMGWRIYDDDDDMLMNILPTTFRLVDRKLIIFI